jgi:hypothetical protein
LVFVPAHRLPGGNPIFDLQANHRVPVHLAARPFAFLIVGFLAATTVFVVSRIYWLPYWQKTPIQTREKIMKKSKILNAIIAGVCPVTGLGVWSATGDDAPIVASLSADAKPEASPGPEQPGSFWSDPGRSMKNPQKRLALRAEIKGSVDRTYDALPKYLNLPPDCFDALKDLLLSRTMALSEAQFSGAVDHQLNRRLPAGGASRSKPEKYMSDLAGLGHK